MAPLRMPMPAMIPVILCSALALRVLPAIGWAKGEDTTLTVQPLFVLLDAEATKVFRRWAAATARSTPVLLTNKEEAVSSKPHFFQPPLSLSLSISLHYDTQINSLPALPLSFSLWSWLAVAQLFPPTLLPHHVLLASTSRCGGVPLSVHLRSLCFA